jgi:hypothetical protein
VVAADEQRSIERQWDECIPVVDHPWPDLTGLVLAFLDELDAEDSDDLITVVIRVHHPGTVSTRRPRPEGPPLPAQHRRDAGPRPRSSAADGKRPADMYSTLKRIIGRPFHRRKSTISG